MRVSDLSPNLLRIKDELASIPKPGGIENLEAVVAILLLDEPEKGLETLLVERAERKGDPWSGQIGLPGGRIKPGESPRTALRREVEEEVGVRLETAGLELGTLPVGHPMRRMEMGVQPWVYGLRVKPEVSLGSEIADSLWVDLKRLPAKRGMSEVMIRNVTRNVESFFVEGKVVWGFTYRVLSELIQMLRT
ncbi:MAG TPA: NUDIX domain-containing protein [Candidatus Bathyarchaeia archaeon]|nr:NUDIX domain-containing protein [Candidatus Bathyarchaeia archaeon]